MAAAQMDVRAAIPMPRLSREVHFGNSARKLYGDYRRLLQDKDAKLFGETGFQYSESAAKKQREGLVTLLHGEIPDPERYAQVSTLNQVRMLQRAVEGRIVEAIANSLSERFPDRLPVREMTQGLELRLPEANRGVNEITAVVPYATDAERAALEERFAGVVGPRVTRKGPLSLWHPDFTWAGMEADVRAGRRDREDMPYLGQPVHPEERGVPQAIEIPGYF